MEFNDLFKLHVPDILSAIFLYLDPPDLESAYVVCPQWRDFIEAHLLSHELTLARLVKSKVGSGAFRSMSVFSHVRIWGENDLGQKSYSYKFQGWTKDL